MNRTLSHPLKVMIIVVGVFFLFFLSLESIAHARAGGGRSSGSRGFSSGGSYQRTTPYRSPGQVSPYQQPMSQPSAGRSFLSGLGGGLMGGMIGSMLFGGHSYAGGYGGRPGFGLGDLLLIVIIVGIIYFIFKRSRAQ